jgi:hypothetical protein
MESGALVEHIPWGPEEQARFLERHEPMADYERVFVERNFEPIVKEAWRWIDDCALWVTSFFDLIINRVRRIS